MKAWRQQLMREQRNLDAEIRKIETAEASVKRDVKECAKRGDTVSTRLLAAELVRSKRAKERIYTSKVHINGVIMEIRSAAGTSQMPRISHRRAAYRPALATMKLARAMQSSTQVMAAMNELVKVRGAGRPHGASLTPHDAAARIACHCDDVEQGNGARGLHR